MAAKKKIKEITLPMPMASAVWLFDNTTFTYFQISEFTGLPMMSIESIADGDMGVGIKGRSPVEFGEMSKEDLDKAQADETFVPQRLASSLSVLSNKKKASYTPISKRSDKPNAIAWIVKHHPDIPDAAIIKLVGTTRTTIKAIRERTHANIQNITPQNPADLELCKWSDLEEVIAKFTKEEEKSAESGGSEIVEEAKKDPSTGFDFANFMPTRNGTEDDS